MWQVTFLLAVASLALTTWFTMHYLYSFPILFSFASVVSSSNTTVDLSWHAPPSTNVSNLQSVINGTGVWGFVFNSSTTPAGLPYCKLTMIMLVDPVLSKVGQQNSQKIGHTFLRFIYSPDHAKCFVYSESFPLVLKPGWDSNTKLRTIYQCLLRTPFADFRSNLQLVQHASRPLH